MTVEYEFLKTLKKIFEFILLFSPPPLPTFPQKLKLNRWLGAYLQVNIHEDVTDINAFLLSKGSKSFVIKIRRFFYLKTLQIIMIFIQNEKRSWKFDLHGIYYNFRFCYLKSDILQNTLHESR